MFRNYEDLYLGLDKNGLTRNYQDGQLRFVRNSDILKRKTPQGIPLRAKEYRINIIMEGHNSYNMNLIDYPLEVGDVLITPPNTIGVFDDFPEHFRSDIIILPLYISDLASKSEKKLPTKVTHLHLGDDEFERLKHLLDLLEEYIRIDIKRPNPNNRCSDHVNYLLLTIFYDLVELSSDNELPSTQNGRDSVTFNKFLSLVNEYGMRERNLGFYADKLNLSTGLMTTLILEQSGKPAMEWIIQTTIMEAKMLLCHTDLLIFEISSQLHFSEPSAFIRFFRKHTGMSPGAYRKAMTEASEK